MRFKMWGMDYSRQHRSRPGSPVRKMCCLRRIRAFSTAEPLPHQTWLGVPTHRGVSRTMPGFESRPGRGHWNIVADDSLRSELPDLAGGLAVGIARCRQCAEIYPLGCDDFRDVSLGPRHVSGATVACVVRGPITYKAIQATQTGPLDMHPCRKTFFGTRKG